MTDGLSRFTSDRRVHEDASWATQDDWESGVAENIDVTASGLVAQPSAQSSEISDRAAHQWKITEGGGSDVEDVIGGEDGTVVGENWTPGDFAGGWGLEFVRNDGDRLETPASAWPDIESSHAYMFTLDSTEIGGIIRHDWDSGFRGPNFRINEQDNSNIRFQYGDGENRIRVYTNDDPFDENKKIRFAFVMRGDSGSADDMEIWANGVQSDLTTHDGGSVSGMPDWEGPVPIGGNYDQGSRSGMYDGIIDNWINFYEAPAKSEIQDDYNNQPWS